MARFRDDESGSTALIIIFMFIIMIMFGGIAVDVMRFEARRVALQQTLDRAALAAASLEQTRTPAAIVDDWFAKTMLDDEALEFVDFGAPVVTSQINQSLRRVTVQADVFSQNFFMSWYSDRDSFATQLSTQATQGLWQIEVILAVDITGSMNTRMGDGRTRIQGLREAATAFVDIVKANDRMNGVSIGIVPYAPQVNLPAALRAQFNELNLSHWNGVPNAGVPNIDCMEIPLSTYTETALSLTLPIRMAAVADTNSSTPSGAAFIAPNLGAPSISASDRGCTTRPDHPATSRNEATANQVLMPTKDTARLNDHIAGLVAAGTTNIALGMRWASALLDEQARPIYDALLTGEPSMAGRPADNDSTETRKIIILMTDGDNVPNTHVLDNYKSGPSPIWLGTDGNYAIRFWPGGTDLNDNARPTNCMGWTIPASAGREYFLPHMKDTRERERRHASEAEGHGTGSLRRLNNAQCDPNAWIAAPTWAHTVPDGSDPDDERDVVTVPDGPDADSLPDVVMITATRLDWSEVWHQLRLSYVVRQLYMRSGVTGTGDFNTVMNLMRGPYMGDTPVLDALLQQNCTAARAAGFEIYGIAFAAPPAGAAQIEACASLPKSSYFYNAEDGDALLAAFQQIATELSDLRLTQ